MHDASCHCGAVTLSVDALVDTLTACTCSLCRRYGALWLYTDSQSAGITASEGALAAYCWGDRLIDFMHCAHCGCLTHYVQRHQSGADTPVRIAINARMFDPKEIEGARVRTFDGAESWRYLD